VVNLRLAVTTPMRVNKMGVSETLVAKEGNNRIRIEIPGMKG